MDLGLYALDWETVGDAGTARVLDHLLEVHDAALGRAFVDAMSNESPLPDAAAAALDDLLRLADAQATVRLPKPAFARRLLPSLADDPLLAVELDLGSEAQRKTFRDFALFSTASVVFLRDDDEPEIEIYDSGKSFTFFADDVMLAGLVAKAGVAREGIYRVD